VANSSLQLEDRDSWLARGSEARAPQEQEPDSEGVGLWVVRADEGEEGCLSGAVGPEDALEFAAADDSIESVDFLRGSGGGGEALSPVS